MMTMEQTGRRWFRLYWMGIGALFFFFSFPLLVHVDEAGT